MQHRQEVIELLNGLAVEVHPALVLEALENAGFDIVKRKPNEDGADAKFVRKAKGK